MNSKRRAGNKGSFYPQSCDEIKVMIQKWNALIDGHLKDKSILKETPRSIIAPHAGYVYSGFSANFAYRILANSKAKRVVVIGPSHHVFIEGISVSEFESYETSCGELTIDLSYIKELKKHFSFTFSLKAHELEHSTETQMPFIKHYLLDAKVVELIYGKVSYKDLAKIVEFVLKDKDNVVVISTDLSHFYTLDQAKRLDHICLEGVVKEDISILERGCEACGKIGVEAMIEAAKALGLKSEILDYRTSADASGDTSRVVGYMSAIFR